MSESRVQSLVRLEGARRAWRLWRNNRGAGKMASGNHVRYGLANDSKALGDELKSGDLIGWRTITITAEMVGKQIAQFVSVECKAEDWYAPTNDADYQAQKRWADLVNAEGGYAVFVNDSTKL